MSQPRSSGAPRLAPTSALDALNNQGRQQNSFAPQGAGSTGSVRLGADWPLPSSPAATATPRCHPASTSTLPRDVGDLLGPPCSVPLLSACPCTPDLQLYFNSCGHATQLAGS